MKKLFLFATLTIFAFTIKAQELNFEETVKYIQEKYRELNSGGANSSLYSFKASRNGDLEAESNGRNLKFNLFDLKNNTKEGVDSFGFLKENKGFALCIHFYSDNNYIAGMIFSPQLTVNGLERIYKALIHLRSLCTKQKDPFDN